MVETPLFPPPLPRPCASALGQAWVCVVFSGVPCSPCAMRWLMNDEEKTGERIQNVEARGAFFASLPACSGTRHTNTHTDTRPASRTHHVHPPEVRAVVGRARGALGTAFAWGRADARGALSPRRAAQCPTRTALHKYTPARLTHTPSALSLTHRDLIKAVRACKTAQEERDVIAKEAAELRAAFREQVRRERARACACVCAGSGWVAVCARVSPGAAALRRRERRTRRTRSQPSLLSIFRKPCSVTATWPS